MSAQPMTLEAGKIMIDRPGTDHSYLVGQHGDIAFTVQRLLQFPAYGFGRHDFFDARGPLNGLDNPIGLKAFIAINANEPAERAVMADEGIGDRANHAARPLTHGVIKDVLQPDDVGVAILSRLVCHAVISDQRDNGAQFLQAPEP